MSANFVDLSISICIADVETDATGRPRVKPGTDEELVRVGGRWDRKRRRWSATSQVQKRFVLRFHRGQEEAARYFADWLSRWVRGDWKNYRRAWSMLLIGGRRSGKTDFACAALVLFAVLSPGARVWAISPTLDTGNELVDALKTLMPRRWYRYKETKNGSATFTLANGSRILLKSAVKPGRLKAGRVDLCLLNEAQDLVKLAYTKLRAAVADRGGIVLMTANPPDAPSGMWVEDHYLKAKRREIECEVFVFDPRKNPWVLHEALSSMLGEVDQKSYDRDVLGLFAAVGDVVLHAYEPEGNWIDPWPGLVDVTAEVTRGELGRAAAEVVAMDFQKTPWMVGLVHRFFRDPTDPSGDILTWIVDEAIADDSDESELVDMLESIPRWTPGAGKPDARKNEDFYRGWAEPGDVGPRHAAVVMDASGFWQDGAHSGAGASRVGMDRTSDRWLRARNWTHLHTPQKDNNRNPAVGERLKAGNARLKSAKELGGKRRYFVAKHCERTAQAFRLCPRKHLTMDKRSEHSHIVDAATYLIYRFFGRPPVKTKPGEYRGAGRYSDRASSFRNVF